MRAGAVIDIERCSVLLRHFLYALVDEYPIGKIGFFCPIFVELYGDPCYVVFDVGCVGNGCLPLVC